MKKTLSFFIAVVMVFSVVPFNAAAVDAEVNNALDAFVYPVTLDDHEVSYYLEECGYDPAGNGWPFGSFGGLYRIGYYFYPVGGSNNKISTEEELKAAFFETFTIKRDFFEKYLCIEPWTYYSVDSAGNYFLIEFNICVSEELVNELNSYSSYEKAYFYAQLYAVLSGQYYGSQNGYTFSKLSEVSNNEYGKIFHFDANFDGEVNTRDSVILKKVILGVDVKCNYYTKDLNGDGATNAKDSFYLKRFLATGEDVR